MRLFPRLQHLSSTTLAFVGAVLLAGCGGGGAKPPTQTVAKVNKEELTVHQVNALLAQQRGVGPQQAEQAGRRVLERLIDQELALQKASELRLDRDPRVVQAVEAARREIIARAYADKIAEGAARPSPAEVRKYYEEHPLLFRERRVYQLQEFVVQAPGPLPAGIVDRLRGSKAPADVAQLLKAQDVKFTAGQVIRAAEQVPLDRLEAVAALKDGQSMVTVVPGGVQVLFVLASRLQPIDEARAAPAIEQFLVNDQKRRLVAQDLQTLRAAAKIEYLGQYAGAAVQVDVAAPPNVAEAAASAAASLEARSAAEPATIQKGPGLK